MQGKSNTLTIYYILLIAVAFLTGTIVILTSSGFSLTSTVEENKYILFSTQRDKVIFSLYKEYADFEYMVSEVIYEDDLSERAMMLRDLQASATTLSDSFAELMVTHDKLLILDLGDQLSSNVQQNHQQDLAVQESLEEYVNLLGEYYLINTNLLSLFEIEVCHKEIDFIESNANIISSLDSCIAKINNLDMTNIETELGVHLELFEDFLGTSRSLYSSLKANNAINAEKYRRLLETKTGAVSKSKSDLLKGYSHKINTMYGDILISPQ